MAAMLLKLWFVVPSNSYSTDIITEEMTTATGDSDRFADIHKSVKHAGNN